MDYYNPASQSYIREGDYYLLAASRSLPHPGHAGRRGRSADAYPHMLDGLESYSQAVPSYNEGYFWDMGWLNYTHSDGHRAELGYGRQRDIGGARPWLGSWSEPIPQPHQRAHHSRPTPYHPWPRSARYPYTNHYRSDHEARGQWAKSPPNTSRGTQGGAGTSGFPKPDPGTFFANAVPRCRCQLCNAHGASMYQDLPSDHSVRRDTHPRAGCGPWLPSTDHDKGPRMQSSAAHESMKYRSQTHGPDGAEERGWEGRNYGLGEQHNKYMYQHQPVHKQTVSDSCHRDRRRASPGVQQSHNVPDSHPHLSSLDERLRAGDLGNHPRSAKQWIPEVDRHYGDAHAQGSGWSNAAVTGSPPTSPATPPSSDEPHLGPSLGSPREHGTRVPVHEHLYRGVLGTRRLRQELNRCALAAKALQTEKAHLKREWRKLRREQEELLLGQRRLRHDWRKFQQDRQRSRSHDRTSESSAWSEESGGSFEDTAPPPPPEQGHRTRRKCDNANRFKSPVRSAEAFRKSQELLEQYNIRWAAFSRGADPEIPWPTSDLEPTRLSEPQYGMSQTLGGNHADLMRWNAFSFFASASGAVPVLKKSDSNAVMDISSAPLDVITALRNQARVDVKRWHQDKLACRNADLASDERAKAVFAAAHRLYGICTARIKRFERTER